MIFQYYPDTDMLYIQLIQAVSVESEEVASGIVLDFDENGRVIGIEIEDANKLIDFSKLEMSALPIESLVFSKMGLPKTNMPSFVSLESRVKLPA